MRDGQTKWLRSFAVDRQLEMRASLGRTEQQHAREREILLYLLLRAFEVARPSFRVELSSIKAVIFAKSRL